MDWWTDLAPLVKTFYSIATFFTILFLWQFIMAMLGMTAENDVDADADGDFDADADGHDADVDDATVAFKLLSLRSIIAFGMLFGWAAGMYLQNGAAMLNAILLGMGWGVAGMLIVAGGFYAMKKLTETGTATLASAVGNQGVVTLNIPADGVGKVRIMVGNQLQHVTARSASGESIDAGTAIIATRVAGHDTLIVNTTPHDQGAQS